MEDPKKIADEYIALWNERDAAQRQARLESWTVAAGYADPLMQALGRQQISSMIGAVQDRFPEHSFTLTGSPDGHGPYVRFSWLLSPEYGPPAAGGTDFIRLSEEGLVAEVIGFLDGTADT